MDKQIYTISLYDDSRLKDYVNTSPLPLLHKMKIYLDDQYYNTGNNSGLDDYQYDILKEALEARDPGYVVPVGARIREGENRVKLPFWLGSMSKFKPDNAPEIAKWLDRNTSSQYMVEDKLDGVSCLALFQGGKIKLYTRGDGVVGADISALAQYFSSIPKKLREDLVVRGELIMEKNIFNKKYSSSYANPRNLVAGRTGAKVIKEGLTDNTFVAYEIVGVGVMPPPSKQLDRLDKMGFTTVRRRIIPTLTIDILIETLLDFQQSSPYDIDGIIVQPDIPYERNTTGNPDYAFAFKMRLDGNLTETNVIQVHWNVSKWGYLKPRIEIEPVQLSGVTITYTTGFNAAYIVANDVGPGAKIEITRSGDVIPYITKVLKGAPGGPEMPDIPYKWNDTEVDIMILEFGPTMCIKLISSFFSKMGVKFLGEKTILKLYESGLDTLLKIISAPQSRIEQVPGMGDRGAERIYTNIHSHMKDMDMPLVLGASGVFGFGLGTRRVTLLFDSIPDILVIYKVLDRPTLEARISAVEGFGGKTTDKILDYLEYADKLVQSMRKFGTFKVKEMVGDDLKDMKAVFTGFRDKDLTDKVISRGGKVSSGGVTGTTTVLVHSPSKDGKESKKLVDAKERGIPIYTKDEFIAKYFF